jgi:hypothetical protein
LYIHIIFFFTYFSDLENFSDSEQKVITRLLVEKTYLGNLNFQILPEDIFPSGFDYFNLHLYIKKGNDDSFDDVFDGDNNDMINVEKHDIQNKNDGKFNKNDSSQSHIHEMKSQKDESLPKGNYFIFLQ